MKKLVAFLMCFCVLALTMTSCDMGVLNNEETAPSTTWPTVNNGSPTVGNVDSTKEEAASTNQTNGTSEQSSSGVSNISDEVKAALKEELLAELRGEIGNSEISAADLGYVIVTDHIDPNSYGDVSDELQRIINENPNKIIYFPEGTYLISKPILTSAVPNKSVSLLLSNYAVIKATSDWTGGSEAMIRLGGAEACNDVHSNGANYYLKGGTIDGSGVANGVSIDSGRLTTVSDVAIKRTNVGLHVKKGANNGSADISVKDITIIGADPKSSIGMVVDAHDNIFSDIFMQGVLVGVRVNTVGNFFRNIHTVGTSGNYENSIGFDDHGNANVYDTCYSDQYAVGFMMSRSSTYTNCICYWYRGDVDSMVGFKSTGEFNSVLTNCRVIFNTNGTGNTSYEFIQVATPGGSGCIYAPIFNESLDTVKTYLTYLKGDVIR